MASILLYVANSVIDLSNILLCYQKIYGADIKNKKQWLVLAFAGIMLLNFLNGCFRYPVNPVHINLLYAWIISVVLIKEKKIKCFLLFPSVCIVSSIINVAASFVLALFHGLTQVQVAQDLWLTLVANSVFSIGMILLIVLQKKKLVPQYQMVVNQTSLQGAITVGAYAIYFLITMLMIAGEKFYLPGKTSNFLGLFASVVGILFFFVCFRLAYVLHQNTMMQHEKNMIDVQLEAQENYIQLIQKKDLDMRKFRHDVSEHMNVISYCMENGRYDEATEYLEKTKQSFLNAKLKKYTGIASIDAVLSDKEETMIEKGIVFAFKNSYSNFSIEVDVFDVCTIIINLLNNAIRACEDLPKEEKIIEFTFDSDGNKIFLSEKNACHKKVDFTPDGCPISDKKEENHGLGSKNIQTVVKKYDGDIYYKVSNNQFIVEVII